VCDFQIQGIDGLYVPDFLQDVPSEAFSGVASISQVLPPRLGILQFSSLHHLTVPMETLWATI